MSGFFHKTLTKRLSAVFFVIFSVWWGLFLTSPPAPKPVDAPEAEFSAERAYTHVQSIAEAPHMLGTAEHDSVRRYILRELRNLGLKPRVETGISLVTFRGYHAARTQNIIARLEGADSDRTILLMAHYDSVPYAPGAADDAAGVAAILEVLRAIRAGEPLHHDLLVLLTDGEELGLMGARHFAENSPLLDEVDLVLNLEARGSSGSSIMFETNSGNANLIPQFAESTGNAVANSLTYAVYKILPNDTDFTVFKPCDLQGLNYGFIDDYLDYHTMQDNPANLSLPSLQHHGENILDNVRYFGNRSGKLTADSDLVYFNGPFGGIIYYPESWTPLLVSMTLLLFAIFLVIAHQRFWISLRGVMIGFAAYFGIIIVAAGITWFGWSFIREVLRPEYHWLRQGETYASRWYLWFFITLVSVLAIPWLKWIQSKTGIINLIAGIFTTWTVLLLGTAYLLPAAHYLLLWPLFFGIVGLLLSGEEIHTGEWSWRTLLILAFCLFIPLFLFPFYITLVQVALTTRMVAASILLYMLLFGMLWPLLELINGKQDKQIYAMLAGALILLFTGATLNDGYTPAQKKQNSLVFFSNLDTGKNYWVSTNRSTDDWTAHFLGESPGDTTMPEVPVFQNRPLLFNPAPDAALKAPKIELLAQEIEDSIRTVTLRFSYDLPAQAVTIDFSDDLQVWKASLEGKTIFNAHDPLDEQPEILNRVTYFRDFRSPFVMSLTYRNRSSSPEIRVTSYHTDFPDILMNRYPERPSHTMPAPSPFTTGRIWTRSLEFENLARE
ncbi:MAG: M20/M25/M40 family metallo-hydrolase [Balneolaceae bacterium]|nr:M20/M25/M40 family metallo-hydrolase [Balneolaceae bacterium]